MNPTVSKLLVEFERLLAAGYGHRWARVSGSGIYKATLKLVVIVAYFLYLVQDKPLDENGQPVGAIWMRLFAGEERGYGYIDNQTPEIGIAVLPEYRGHGIGTNLLSRFISSVEGTFDSLRAKATEILKGQVSDTAYGGPPPSSLSI